MVAVLPFRVVVLVCGRVSVMSSVHHPPHKIQPPQKKAGKKGRQKFEMQKLAYLFLID